MIKPTLFVHRQATPYGNRYWIDNEPTVNGKHGADIYFQDGSDKLHKSDPTWFNSEYNAVMAAIDQGWPVLSDTNVDEPCPHCGR